MQTLVPQTELTFPLHFGRCEQPPPPPPPDGTELGASGALPPRGERVARVQLSEGQWNGGRPVPAPSSGYPYAVHLCLTLPDLNAKLRRGEMWVLSQAQARLLVGGPFQRLIDVGAGDGAVTAQLAPLAREVTRARTRARARSRAPTRALALARARARARALALALASAVTLARAACGGMRRRWRRGAASRRTGSCAAADADRAG